MECFLSQTKTRINQFCDPHSMIMLGVEQRVTRNTAPLGGERELGYAKGGRSDVGRSVKGMKIGIGGWGVLM